MLLRPLQTDRWDRSPRSSPTLSCVTPPTTTHRDLKKILGFEDTTDASPLLSSTKALLRLYGMVAPQKPAKAAKMTMQTVQHLAQRDGDGRGLGALDPSLHGTVLLVRGR